MAARSPEPEIRSIADLEVAIDKLVAPLGLALATSTWRHTPGEATVVTIRLTTTTQLSLFGGDVS